MNWLSLASSKAPFRAQVLFQKKKDKTFWMCVDCRALNKWMVKNKYPLHQVKVLFDRLGQASVFLKLDLHSRYYRVHIAEGDEPKIACITYYGFFEFL